jgi:hypothetical protein
VRPLISVKDFSYSGRRKPLPDSKDGVNLLNQTLDVNYLNLHSAPGKDQILIFEGKLIILPFS